MPRKPLRHSSGGAAGIPKSAPRNFASDSFAAVDQEQISNYSAYEDLLKVMELEIKQLEPRRERLRRLVMDALAFSTSESLRGCRLEKIGSTSWGGDVPQSDVDLVLITPSGSASRHQVIQALRDLRLSLIAVKSQVESSGTSSTTGQELEVLETASVPILRAYIDGIRCDVSVDQPAALALRDYLHTLLEGWPEVRGLIRLVKMWIHGRGLPLASEGGLPSLAWSLIALRLAQERPAGTSVDILLYDFFENLQRLDTDTLVLCRSQSVEHTATTHFKWSARSDVDGTRNDNWVPLIVVEFPTQADRSSGTPTIAPPSMPPALAMLYVSEVGLALRTLKRAAGSMPWLRFCEGISTQVFKPSVSDMLHLVMSEGKLYLGWLCGIYSFPGALRGDAWYRRDSSTQLALQLCTPREFHAEAPLRVSFQVESRCDPTSTIFYCSPCNWICSLPVDPVGSYSSDAESTSHVLMRESFNRLAEIVQVCGIATASPCVYSTIITCRQQLESAEPHLIEATMSKDGAGARTCNAGDSKSAAQTDQHSIEKESTYADSCGGASESISDPESQVTVSSLRDRELCIEVHNTGLNWKPTLRYSLDDESNVLSTVKAKGNHVQSARSSSRNAPERKTTVKARESLEPTPSSARGGPSKYTPRVWKAAAVAKSACLQESIQSRRADIKRNASRFNPSSCGQSDPWAVVRAENLRSYRR